MDSRQRGLALGIAAVVLIGVVIFVGAGEDEEVGAPVVACIDSTVSTDEVRESYLPDLAAVAEGAAHDQARFYAAACGQNATGSVNWPVYEQFDNGSYSGGLGDDYLANQMARISNDLEGLVRVSSSLEGTPLGEMLAVAGRQCEHAGGGCSIYLFTDGEWADSILHLPREPVSEAQEEEYLEAYESELGDLSGSVVNFVGVGYGTEIGEVRLNEGRAVAEALIEAAGGEMGAWTVRL